MAEFIPLIMKTLLLQPSSAAKARANFNHELYVDFLAAQVKTLSFVAFFVRLYHVSTFYLMMFIFRLGIYLNIFTSE